MVANGSSRGSRENIDGGRRADKLRPKRLRRQGTWYDIVLQTLKRNDIRLVPYVPDRVLTALIKNIHADPFFTAFPTAREEEAVGIVSGAWMGGMRGAVLMQTSALRRWPMCWPRWRCPIRFR